MRPWPLLVAVALVLLALPASAQPPAYTQGYVARVGLGDIPTAAGEAGEGWNVVEQVRVGNATVQRAFGAEADGDGGIVLALSIPAGLESDAVVVLYVPAGRTVTAPGTPTQELPCTQDDCTIREYKGTAAAPLASPFVVTVTSAAVAPPAGPNPWIYAAVAFVAGCILWALLVRGGMVQKRSRRQSVATAAHEEIAAKEPRPVLEGRKRALMAALKEVEIAHQAKEMDTATYDAVKAGLKRETVNVMRALESTGAETQA